MKVSIVIPAYNEEKVITNCLNSLLKQNYPKKDFEIIVVNDGSEDKTLKVLKKFPVKIIDLKKNQGRMIAREIGVKAAKFPNILLIDSKLIVEKDLLSSLAKIKYQPVIGNILWKEPKNKINLVLTFLKKKIFGGFYTGKFKPAYITKENFDKIPKGTAIFFCDKKLFLESQPKKKSEKDKNASDDTKLFSNIVKKRKILKHPGPKGWRIFREDSGAVVSHLFNRGPKFVDYYFKPGRRYFEFFIIFILFIIANIILAIFRPFWLIYEAGFLILLLVLISLWLSSSFRDFWVSIVYLPQAVIIFSVGIIKGFFLKIITFFKLRIIHENN